MPVKKLEVAMQDECDARIGIVGEGVKCAD